MPFPEFIEEAYAPGCHVWMIQGDVGEEPLIGIVPADGSEAPAIAAIWEQLRHWGYGLWGAVFDGDIGTVRCGWYSVDGTDEPVVVSYAYPVA